MAEGINAERCSVLEVWTFKLMITPIFVANLIVNFTERRLPAIDQMFSHEKLQVYGRALDFAAQATVLSSSGKVYD